MKEVTLSTGKAAWIDALTISQVKRMMELAASGKAMEATVGACVDSINKALPKDAKYTTPAEFEEMYTIAEANELYLEIALLSGLQVGELTANR